MIRSIRAATAVAAALVMATGCSAGGPSTEGETPTTASDPYLSGLVEEAQAGGASVEQVEALETAADRGYIEYEDVKRQFESFDRCLAGQGLELWPEEDQPIAPNLVAPGYSVAHHQVEAEQAHVWIEACEEEHIDYLMGGLWLQPSTVEAQDQEFETHEAEIRGCLERNGVTLADDSSVEDIRAAVTDVLFDTGVECYTPSWVADSSS